MKNNIDLLNFTDSSGGLGYLSVDDIVNNSIHKKSNYASLVDENSLASAHEFYTKCKSNNIKPIIGITINLYDKKIDYNESDLGKLTLIAKNKNGFEILSLVLTELTEDINYSGSFDSKNKIDIESLRNKITSDIIIVDGYKNSYFETNNKYFTSSQNYILSVYDNDLKSLKIKIDNLKKINLNYYIGKTNRYFENSKYMKAVFLHRAFNETYLKNNDSKIDYFYFDESLDGNHQDSYKNDFKNNNFDIKTINLIDSISDLSFDKFAEIEDLVNLDLKSIITKHWKELKDKLPDNETKIKYFEKLKEELKIISSTSVDGIKPDYSNYFSFMYYIKNLADKNDIMCTIRGSSVSSLILYTLGLSSIDPIKHNLMFKRFMNNERIENPDIDIDVSDSRKLIRLMNEDLLSKNVNIAYLSQSKGMRDIKNIISYVAESFYNSNIITKKDLLKIEDDIKFLPKIKISLQDILEKLNKNKDIKDEKILKWLNFYNDSDAVKNIFFQSGILSNKKNSRTIHTSSIIATKKNLHKYSPTKYSKDHDIRYVDLDKKSKFIIKYDILESKVLNFINNFIMKNNKKEEINSVIKSDLNDNNILDMISKNLTTGLFQLSGDVGRDIVSKFGVKSFSDIVLVNALIRNYSEIMEYGFDNFSTNKVNNESIQSKILSESYGLIIYEEQLIKICEDVAGLTFGDSDKIRTSIKNKDSNGILKYKDKFINGCISNKNDFSLNKIDAEKLFEHILNKKYIFNKAHSSSYSIIIYLDAYIKYYYPSEHYQRALSSITDNSDNTANAKKIIYSYNDKYDIENEVYNVKYSQIIKPKIERLSKELIDIGVVFETACINKSIDESYTVLENKKMIPSLINMSIQNDKSKNEKDYYNSMIKIIIKERLKNGNYNNIIDFLERVIPLYTKRELIFNINKLPDEKELILNHLNTLIEIGAFDKISESISTKYIAIRNILSTNLESILFFVTSDNDTLELNLKKYNSDDMTFKTQFYYIEKEKSFFGFSPTELKII
jgi:DNA polymerase-3 subunit alpha